MKTFLSHGTEHLLKGKPGVSTASMAKLFVTETQAKSIDECAKLFGSYGYMIRYPIAEIHNVARAYRIYGGASQIMKLQFACSL